MINVYEVYIKDEKKGVFKGIVPAESEDEAIECVKGNDEVVAIKDVTYQFPIGLDHLTNVLLSARYGQAEIDLILKALQQTVLTL